MTPAGILLTGGASRRLGVDKAMLVRDGERLAHRMARVLAAVADPVVEVGPGVSGLVSVREEPVGAGPLAAFGAGLAALAVRGAGDHPVLLLAVDQPDCPAALLTFLAERPEPGAIVPVVAGRRQPLCARYPAGVAAEVAAALASGERSLRALLDRIAVTEIDESGWGAVAGPEAFADLDEPADLARTGWRPPGEGAVPA